MRKFFITFSILVVLAIGSWMIYQRWLGLHPTKKRLPVMTHAHVHLKWLHQSQFAGIYTAQEKGFYKERNIDLNIAKGGPGSPSIAAVLSGEADFGVAGADDILVEVSKGEPIKAIAVIYRKSPVVYFAFKDTGIKKPEDFVGGKVGIREGTGTYYTYLAMLSNLGIDRSKIIEVKTTPDLKPFIEGRVDVWPGFRINEPKIVERETGRDLEFIKPEDYGVDIYADVLFTRADLIQKNPDLVSAFVEATIEGWEYALQEKNFSEVVSYVMKYALGENIDTTIGHQVYMLRESVPLIKPTTDTRMGKMYYEDWKRTYEVLRRFGLISKDIEVRQAFTEEFVGNYRVIPN